MKLNIRTVQLPFVLILTFIPLSSCTTVYNSPTTFHHTNDRTESLNPHERAGEWQGTPYRAENIGPKEIPVESKEPPKPKIEYRVKSVKVGCSKFVLPALQPEPIVIEADLMKINPDDKKAMLTFLLEHIRRSHEQKVENIKLLKEAVAKHEKTCLK